MAELLGWGAGGVQLLNQEKVQQEQLQMDRIAMGMEQAKLEREQKDAELDELAGQAFTDIASGTRQPGVTGDGGIEDSADALERMADIYFQGGSPKKGVDALESANKLRKESRLAMEAEQSAKKANMQRQLAQTDLTYRVLGTITPGDINSWNRGIDELERSGVFDPAEIASLRELEPDPEVIQMLRDQAISAKDAANLTIREMDLESKEFDRANRAAERRRANALAEAKLRETNRHNEVMEKQGGEDAANAPTSAERASVDAVIINEVFGGTPPKGRSLAALNAGVTAVASRAKQLVKETRGLSWDAAVTQAVVESQAAGDWNTEDDSWFGEDTRTFDGKGKTPQTAMPVPESQDKVKVGRYYIMPDGTPAKWDGSNFVADE